MAVAKMPPLQQREWLARAVEGDQGEHWTVSRLDEALKAGDADGQEVAWIALVKFEYQSAEARDEAVKQFELEGREVKPVTKRA